MHWFASKVEPQTTPTKTQPQKTDNETAVDLGKLTGAAQNSFLDLDEDLDLFRTDVAGLAQPDSTPKARSVAKSTPNINFLRKQQLLLHFLLSLFSLHPTPHPLLPTHPTTSHTPSTTSTPSPPCSPPPPPPLSRSTPSSHFFSP